MKDGDWIVQERRRMDTRAGRDKSKAVGRKHEKTTPGAFSDDNAGPRCGADRPSQMTRELPA